MRGNSGQLFVVVIIHRIDGILILGIFDGEKGMLKGQRADIAAVVGVVRDFLGDDIHGSRKGCLGGRNTLFLIDIGDGFLFKRFFVVGLLCANQFRERCKPAFACDGRSRFLFLFISSLPILSAPFLIFISYIYYSMFFRTCQYEKVTSSQ